MTDPVIVRGDTAETVGLPPTTVRLLADADATQGALSTQRVTLGSGADGAAPHYHRGSTELFYVLDGEVRILIGESVVTGREGDLVIVPPTMAHAFGAAPGSPTDLLILITPGVERFGYFRLLGRLGKGEATLEELLESQEMYDNHFVDSPTWKTARTP